MLLDVQYGDRVWSANTTDGYEIAPMSIEIEYIKEL